MSVKAAIKLLQSHPVLSLLQINQKLKDIRIQGWARRVETRGKFLFLHVSDGCSLKTIQAVVQRDICPKVSVGSAVDIVGDWVMSNGKQQNMELFATNCEVVGLQQKSFSELPTEESCADVTRRKYHLRMKSIPFMCLLRLRSRLDQLSRSFFQKELFFYVDTPLLTHNDCEGAGDIFIVQAGKRNYFGDQAVYLPVSSQLHLESFVGSLPKVYTIAPALRADHSQTRQHLAEFRMLEAEYAFADDLEQLCDLVERYVNYVIDGMLSCDMKEIKSMMQVFCNEAECFDLLAPFVGELAGGSLREPDSEELRRRGCDDSLDWYLEMRQHGHPPSAGFGIGLERFMQALFGILNIKDTVAFPRWYKHCPS
ncbi:unnamed protein product [Wuchereria bancrofti]|uniref:Aminoacyl-transfer RNA synthetases class-II family profile domain-containing protein n=1 Tax=Wuchereria bancrofti TaxID=6293 RepID=A0A3P7ECT8_WUCBA|nr:unnamed protein product [Wuchereria bancrofti]